MDGRKINWHRMTPEETIKELGTDSAKGLSGKEARLRLRKYGAHTLFDRDLRSKSPASVFLTDPSVLFFLFCCILALCFGHGPEGVGMIAGVAVFLCGFTLFLRSVRSTEQKIRFRKLPDARVLRNGKWVLIPVRAVVPGDVLLLGAGDVVPSDCRLLSSKGLTVRTMMPDENGKPIWRLYPKNHETVYSGKAQAYPPTAENMLYGGSELIAGTATAVVTATGTETYLGGMTAFRIPAERRENRNAGLLGAARGFLRKYHTVVPAVFCLIAVIGLFTAPSSRGTVGVLLTLGGLLAATAPSWLSFLLRLITHHGTVACVFNGGDDSVLPESADALDRLGTATELFVLGHFATSDGVPVLYRAATGQGEVPFRDAGEHISMRPLAEAVCLLHMGKSRTSFGLLRSAEEIYRDELCRYSQLDVKSLAAGVREVVPLSPRVGGDRRVGVRTQLESFELTFTERESALKICTHCLNERNLPEFFPEDKKSRITELFRRSVSEGCRAFLVFRRQSDTEAFVGMIALRETFSEDVLPSVKTLEDAGLRVTFFADGEDPAEVNYLTQAGLAESVLYRSRLPEKIGDLTEYYGKYRVFAGFSQTEIALLERALNEKGRRVGVLINRPDDARLMHGAHLILSCDRLEQRKGRALSDAVIPDGTAYSRRGVGSVRRHADLLIPRAGKTGGGLSAVAKAFSVCRETRRRILSTVPFLSASQAFLLAFTAISVSFGIGALNGGQLLYLGVLMPFAGTLWMHSLPLNPRDGSALVPDANERKKPWISGALSGCLFALFAVVMKFCGILTYESAPTFTFFGALLIETVLLFERAVREGLTVPKRKAVLPLLLLLPPLALAAVSAFLPWVAAASGMLSVTVRSVLPIPLSPAIVILSSAILSPFFRRTAK